MVHATDMTTEEAEEGQGEAGIIDARARLAGEEIASFTDRTRFDRVRSSSSLQEMDTGIG